MSLPGDNRIDFLTAQPGVRRVPTQKVEMILMPDFLSPDHCDELIQLIERDRRPSTLADHNGDATFRTSETCDLDPANESVCLLEDKLTAFTGIEPARGEQLQGQRYEAGQQFKPHTDWFNPNGADWEKFCSQSGQRTWTFMIYLNPVDAGGVTRFKNIGKTIQPERGKLLGWNNCYADGAGNPDTLHHAMKVRKGLKYVITKWYREKPWG